MPHMQGDPRKGRTAAGRRLGLGLLCCLGVLGLVWDTPRVWGSQARVMPTAAASQALAAGQEAFQQGDLEGAASRWRDAARFSAQAQQAQGQSVALTHLARAYEALGLPRQAEESLQTALHAAKHAQDRTQQAVILGQLGHLATTTGQLPAAEAFMHQAESLAHTLEDAELTAVLLHTRGNLLMAQQRPHEALKVYQDSATQAQQAQQTGLLARALVHAAVAAERDTQPQRSIILLREGLEHLRALPASHDTAYDFLLVGRTYHRLAHTDPALVLQAADVWREVATMAQTLQDPRALAYAWGYLGRLYEDAQRYPEALELTRRALRAAQQVPMPEALYLWQWQTGRVLRALGELPDAIAAYGRAIDTAQSVRTTLLRGSFRGDTFRTAVGPLYFELVDLLLQRATALEQRAPEAVYPQYAWYLQQARTIVELFKKEEFRDYFGDACVAAARPNTALLDHVAPDAVIIYPILLPDRTEVLVSLPTGLQRLTVPVTGPALEHQVRIFLNALADRDPLRYLRHAQRLYAWLIRPLEGVLAAQPVQTLVLVPDGALRSLPLAALHDGHQFLIEKYALAMTPGVILTDPRPLARANLQVLAVGTSDAVDAFAPLPRVPEELHGLQRLYGGAILLNQDFTPERLEETVRRGRFGILHIAAHGHFAPEAAASFLLTTQGKVTMERLATIVGRLRFREPPLELLTFSACDTARGDDRAALGFAGVAIQAGARSALATLWRVDDEATTRVMTAFYQHLQHPAMSRAQALQRAQIALLQAPQYAEPFFWAPFLLLNNWL